MALVALVESGLWFRWLHWINRNFPHQTLLLPPILAHVKCIPSHVLLNEVLLLVSVVVGIRCCRTYDANAFVWERQRSFYTICQLSGRLSWVRALSALLDWLIVVVGAGCVILSWVVEVVLGEGQALEQLRLGRELLSRKVEARVLQSS